MLLFMVHHFLAVMTALARHVAALLLKAMYQKYYEMAESMRILLFLEIESSVFIGAAFFFGKTNW